MTTKYWQMNLKGERSADEIQAAVGKGGGLLVRYHVERGGTRVYFVGPESASSEVPMAIDGADGPHEVRVEEVVQLS